MFYMKKLLSVLLVLAMVVSCVAVMQMTTFAASEETVFEVNFDDKNTEPDLYVGSAPTYSKTVTDDAAHGNVLEFQIGDARHWVSPCWDFGLKIKEFADKNSGKDICLTVSADVKLDNAKSVTIRFRNNHGNDKILGVYDMKRLYDNVENGKWITLNGSYTIMAADIAKLTSNTDIGTSLDDLYALDSSKPVTAKVDNYKVTVKTVEKPIGYEYTIIQTSDAWNGYFIYNSAWNSDLSFLKSEIKDGKVTLDYTVYNMSDVDIQIKPLVQVGWKFLMNGDKRSEPLYNIEAKTSKKISFVFDMAADGKATNEDGVAIDLTSATLRFDYLDGEGNLGVLPVGTKFAIIPDNEKLVEYMSVLSGVTVEGTSISEAPVLPTPGEDETPTPGEEATPTPIPQAATGFTAELLKDVTELEKGQGQWFKTNPGVFSAADVANNKLTVKFPVKNTGNQDIKVRLELQTIHKKGDGNPVWAGPSAGAYVDIPEGETVDLEYSADVKNGKISVTAYDNTAEYDVSAFFARIDIKNAEGGDTFDKGMAFTAFTGKKLADAFFEMKDENGKGEFYKVELTYANPAEGGDLLPVAFIAVAVVATAALVVVSRKKREEF